MANKSSKPKEITRAIKDSVRSMLWGRAAGRCQFKGCNRPLYKSPITTETVNISEAAHIYSFSEDGPRGWGPFVFNKDKLNDIDNLMLMCHDCHKTIDQDKEGVRYSADLLRQWKKEHEERIWLVTSIGPNNKSHVVLYGADIGKEKSPLQFKEVVHAMFPRRFPAEQSIELSLSSELIDSTDQYWDFQAQNLEKVFERKVKSVIETTENVNFSLFSFAPMPLLIKLGTLFTDKVAVETYQPIREPKGWMWQTRPDDFSFVISKPETIQKKKPVLILSLSAEISSERITTVLGLDVEIWKIYTPSPHQHNDFIRSPEQLSEFRSVVRKTLEEIQSIYGLDEPLHLFPAMPISCAVEFGRVRMPKATMPWIIYDENRQHGSFIKALTI
ncbi:SAVED domain-containing protein [Acinetobacter wuhouensis]|uniref:HNH endonuclease n=1 Tax=Acinetobacter wuhouensis TaxID=1879050 RepID=A0A3G2T6R0_9GAMM|nr:SAVED domain-containing protein [Acinetobacter wuhouensis]AYO55949.1 HNH endonuclease [Acinetobacter wuhouensis]